MAKRSKPVRRRFPKRWSSDNVQVRSKAARNSFMGVVRNTVPGHEAVSYRKHMLQAQPGRVRGVDKHGKEFFAHPNVIPVTEFSLKRWVGDEVPLIEVLKKLSHLELSREDNSGGIITDHSARLFTKFIKNGKEYYNPLSGIIPDETPSQGKFHGIDKFQVAILENNPLFQIRMYFSGMKFFFVKVQRGKVYRSMFYTSRERAMQVFEFGDYVWDEEISLKEDA